MIFISLIKKVKSSRVEKAWTALSSYIRSAKTVLLFWHASLWQRYYRSRNWVWARKQRYGSVATVLILVLMLVASGLTAPQLQSGLDAYFSDQVRFTAFQSLLSTLGGAMVGATAIAFSLIMFAMQVNVERMPHGMFRKFSADIKLLGSFVITFLLAVSISVLSLIPDKSWVAISTLIAIWALLLSLGLFIFAYRRALNLISPTKQLSIIVADVRRNFRVWERAARRSAPLFNKQGVAPGEDERERQGPDVERLTYYQLFPGWTAAAQQGISHCISFARRYAEHGDHEIAGLALNALVSINSEYVKAKGKTFFADNYLFDNPLTSDGFINNTLEHLRQNVQIGVSRGDEQQIEQSFRALAQLCHVYMGIDYATENAIKSHAHLAAEYLSGAIETVGPHNMPDVLMEGVRLLGEVAQLIVAKKDSVHVATISEKLSLLACTGAVNEKYRPVTQVAVMQLAKLTLALIRSDSFDIRFAARKIRNDVKFVAEMYLKIPDTPLSSVHSSSLAPYYSGTSDQTLTAWLTDLTNAISKAEADDINARRVIDHIKQWSDQMYQTEKELLLLAIEKRSHFTFDIMHWVVHITKLLLAVSNADACDEHNSESLRKNALWLISVLSWVADEKDAIIFAENHGMTENLFETAADARQRGCDDVALKIRDLLLDWTFKAGKYETGWAILERACYGLACLHIIFEIDDEVLLGAIEKRVTKEDAINTELRFRASKEIRDKAENYQPDRYAFMAIESAMAQVDQKRLRTLLVGIADRLAPEKGIQQEGKNQE